MVNNMYILFASVNTGAEFVLCSLITYEYDIFPFLKLVKGPYETS